MKFYKKTMKRNIYFGTTSMLTSLGNQASTLKAMSEGCCGLPQEVKGSDFEDFVEICVKEVLEKSAISANNPELLFVLSTTKGNVALLAESVEEISPRTYLYDSAERMSKHFGFVNKPIVISNACISGVSALIVARELLLSGKYKHAIVVGCDILSRFITSGFESFKSISPNPCKPYDAERDGLSLGEACGAVLLTTQESLASIPFVCLAGGAITNDANHISGPSRTGDGLSQAINRALEYAGISASSVGFVNAHGTATAYNDEMESKAMNLSGLGETPLNSLKGYIGHTLGASGIVETIACLHQLRQKEAFGTLGFSSLGTPLSLKVSASPQKFDFPVCVKTASGFGGCNAAIVLTMDEPKTFSVANDGLEIKPEEEKNADEFEIKELASYTLPQSEQPFADFIREEYRALNEQNMKFYKMSDLCKAAYVSMMKLLQQVEFDIDTQDNDVAVILANKSSSLETDIAHQIVLNQNNPEGTSPAIFVYTLPNVVAGEICIRHKIRGNNTFFIENNDSGLSEDYARLLLKTGKAHKAICGWCEKMGENWNVKLKLLSI